jgi:hypothetical protein
MLPSPLPRMAADEHERRRPAEQLDAYVSRIEAGQRTPSEKALRKLAEKLGTTALYLETGDAGAPCPHCGRGRGA